MQQIQQTLPLLGCAPSPTLMSRYLSPEGVSTKSSSLHAELASYTKEIETKISTVKCDIRVITSDTMQHTYTVYHKSNGFQSHYTTRTHYMIHCIYASRHTTAPLHYSTPLHSTTTTLLHYYTTPHTPLHHSTTALHCSYRGK